MPIVNPVVMNYNIEQTMLLLWGVRSCLCNQTKEMEYLTLLKECLNVWIYIRLDYCRQWNKKQLDNIWWRQTPIV